jgi:hypothetical protein
MFKPALMPEAAFEAVEPTDVADTAVRREESSRVLEPDLLAADMLLDKDSTEARQALRSAGHPRGPGARAHARVRPS